MSLVENLNVEDVNCLKYALSKGLGIGIVVGGSIMKVPQLLLSESCFTVFSMCLFRAVGPLMRQGPPDCCDCPRSRPKP